MDIEKVIYYVLPVLLLASIYFMKVKRAWKVFNLVLFLSYFPATLYFMYTDPTMDGFAGRTMGIILTFGQLIFFGLVNVFGGRYLR